MTELPVQGQTHLGPCGKTFSDKQKFAAMNEDNFDAAWGRRRKVLGISRERSRAEAQNGNLHCLGVQPDTLPINMKPDRGLQKEMVFKDPPSVRFHVTWWEGIYLFNGSGPYP